MSAKRSILPVFIPHLGCPHDCVFCNQKRISGSSFPAGPEEVAGQIAEGLHRLKNRRDKPELAFYGGSFTAIPDAEQEALLEAARPWLEQGLLSGIRLSTRPDCIDGEVLDRLRRYGVGTVELGAQSMDDRVLTLSGRGHTAADTEHAAAMVRDAGFSLVLQMMTGLPGSSRESDLETAGRIAALRPEAVRIYPTVIVRDTALYKLWKAGAYAEHTVEQAVSLCAELLPLFEREGIPVIRLGLNPTEALSAGDAAGGAYHPAFGELVRSRVLLNKVLDQVGETRGEVLRIEVHPLFLSAMIGQKRCNVRKLRSLGFDKVEVIPSETTKKGEIGWRIVAKRSEI